MSAEPGLVQRLRLQPWTVQAQGNWVCEQCVHFGVTLAPHERLPEILVVPREKTPTGAAARGNP